MAYIVHKEAASLLGSCFTSFSNLPSSNAGAADKLHSQCSDSRARGFGNYQSLLDPERT